MSYTIFSLWKGEDRKKKEEANTKNAHELYYFPHGKVRIGQSKKWEKERRRNKKTIEIIVKYSQGSILWKKSFVV